LPRKGRHLRLWRYVAKQWCAWYGLSVAARTFYRWPTSEKPICVLVVVLVAVHVIGVRYHVKGRTWIRSVQVPANPKVMNSGDVFVFDTGGQGIWVWVGDAYQTFASYPRHIPTSSIPCVTSPRHIPTSSIPVCQIHTIPISINHVINTYASDPPHHMTPSLCFT
jgi:hypothetical protein